MVTNKNLQVASYKLHGKNGYTLVELLIALALTGIILAAVYGVYIAFYKTSGSQDLLIEAQQNARAGIAVIERDLINTGLNAEAVDVITKAKDDEIEFIFRDPRMTKISGTDTPNVRKKVTYKLKTEDGVKYLTIKYKACDLVGYDDDENKIVGYIADTNGLVFTYYAGDGNCVNGTLPNCNEPSNQSERNNIRLVKVSLTTKTSSNLPTSNAPSTIKVSTQVYLRNMGVSGGSASDCD